LEFVVDVLVGELNIFTKKGSLSFLICGQLSKYTEFTNDLDLHTEKALTQPKIINPTFLIFDRHCSFRFSNFSDHKY
jgi:hypothetical protein